MAAVQNVYWGFNKSVYKRVKDDERAKQNTNTYQDGKNRI